MSDKVQDRREAGLLEARKIYGKEAEEALRAHLSMIGQELYLWMADLYIPRKCICNNFDSEGNSVCLLKKDEDGNPLCYGGGYYFSNSARDYDIFKIDIESTVQALNFLQTVGMLRGYDNDYTKAFPRQMQLDVCAFAKSLQDSEDGYFYHPQWGKNIIPSRQGRDLSWATSILKSFGDMPLYDTKNGHKGSLGAPSGVANAKNGSSTWISHLQTLEAFKEYLLSFDLKNKSYSSCNDINAQSGQFAARDKEGLEKGEFTNVRPDGYAVGGFIEALETIFNKQQNVQNGLWEDEIHYNAVNGLMKISSAYNAMGLKFNYAEQAFASAVKMALLSVDIPDVKGKVTSGAVDVYNPWVAMYSLIHNVKKFGTEDELSNLQKMLSDNVVDLIKATTEKTRKFKKPDGSFGYTWILPDTPVENPTTFRVSQRAPVAYNGLIEGDINGGSIATRGIFTNMVLALGLDLPMFSDEDFKIYIERIKKNCGYK